MGGGGDALSRRAGPRARRDPAAPPPARGRTTRAPRPGPTTGPKAERRPARSRRRPRALRSVPRRASSRRRSTRPGATD
ncbi:MAG: hypothetical protein FJ296_00360 [Planctomycetes bacterium]|nr:hypothetical protein [Planctomycetota bacterium]